MSLRNADARARENQAKFIQQRINNVERHFSDLCQLFGAYSRKLARLRDKGDQLAKGVLAYAESEASSTKSGLTGFAERLSSVQDYRQAMVDRLSQRVVHPLTLYGQNFKHTREDMKATFAARTKEINQQKRLENIKKKNPNNRQQIILKAQAESKLHRANADASRSNKNLEDQMDSFERKRLLDLKNMLSEFVKIEMLFHAKALEVHTEAWQHLHAISDEDDLEEFRNSLRPFNATLGSSNSVLANSRTSLNSTGRSSKPASSSSSTKHKPGRGRQDTSRIQDVEDDEDDDDDDEDDEEGDDDEYEDEVEYE